MPLLDHDMNPLRPVTVEKFSIEHYEDTRLDQSAIPPKDRKRLCKIIAEFSDGTRCIARDIEPELISF